MPKAYSQTHGAQNQANDRFTDSQSPKTVPTDSETHRAHNQPQFSPNWQSGEHNNHKADVFIHHLAEVQVVPTWIHAVTDNKRKSVDDDGKYFAMENMVSTE